MAQCPPKYALVSTFRLIKVLMIDFQKKGLDKKKVFVVRGEAPYFSEALDFIKPIGKSGPGERPWPATASLAPHNKPMHLYTPYCIHSYLQPSSSQLCNTSTVLALN